MWCFLPLFYATASSVDFRVSELDSPVQETFLCGVHQDVLLVLTQSRNVYRSDDSGFTWKLLKDLLMREGRAQADGPHAIGEVSRVEVSPADRRLVVMLGTRGINWFSDDCGGSIWALNYGRPISSFQFHPKHRDWGLAGSCPTPDPCFHYSQLYLTKDLGLEWTLVTSYVLQFAWAQTEMSPQIQEITPDNRIYVVYLKEKTGDQSELLMNSANFVYSDDYFQTKTVILPQITTFYPLGAYLLVKTYENDTVNLLISSFPLIYDFEKVELPVKYGLGGGFNVLESGNGGVILHVSEGNEGRFGHVFVSDKKGVKYTVSLLRNSKGIDNNPDFVKINRLDGIYIANIADKIDKNLKNRPNSPHFSSLNSQSVITFNKGGTWESLKSPQSCGFDVCNLHLHSLSSEKYPPVYSPPSATGLVLGIGNTGPYLSQDENDLSVFISNDGGGSWYAGPKGVYLYEIGDHGAIIVLVSLMGRTDKVMYSWDEGQTWDSVKVTEKPFTAEEIVAENYSISQRFLILGKNEENTGIAVGIDFSSLNKPQCRSPETPNSDESDYEWWAPSDGRVGEACLLGRKLLVERRKISSDCYNGEVFERLVVREDCVCGESDYECDMGYVRTGSSACEPIPGYDFPSNTCKLGQLYVERTAGYRKITGDSCVSGEREVYESERLECRLALFPGTVVMSAVVFVVVIGLVMWKYETIKSLWRGYSQDLSAVPDSVDN